MLSNRHPRHARLPLGLLVCLFACLLQALAWASMPLPIPASTGERVVICTANGMQSLSLADFKARAGQRQDDQDAPDAPDASPGCALCPFVGALALTPAVPVLPALVLGHYPYAAIANTNPVVVPPFEISQARAPPGIA
ncbi:DUF2946 family protein [Pseudomonas extremaustralis]|uniref:DUF2946 family protein n=2 Tax=Pseudomonas extremaustralis TaxID=359110 RepID=UPI0021CA0B7A|nr:DUF2946 family protein [Pseudomonas extremaustralis]MDB1113798.1 DUF2946 family protein [Pseudomonas extremaustralis]